MIFLALLGLGAIVAGGKDGDPGTVILGFLCWAIAVSRTVRLAREG